MKKQIYFAVVLSMLCMPGLIRAASDGWKKTLEQKYLDSGIEGDDVILSSEIYSFYDAGNRLALETIPEDGRRTMYEYNDQDLCIAKTTLAYDEEAGQWFGSSRETYTYDENGRLKTRTPFSYDWDGNLQPAIRYYSYTYDDSGNLTREESLKVGTDAVINYTEYIYQDGRKVSAKSYGSENDLTSELIYTYNPDGTLSEMLTKAFLFTVDPVNLVNKEREVYAYTDGQLSETIVLTPKTGDRTQWVNSKKQNFEYNPNNGKIVSMTNAIAKINVDTGEFLRWSQLTRTDYTYSEALSSQRTPGNLAYRVKSSKVLLGWDAPASTAGLSGFNVYKNYVLLATVGASEKGYVDSQVKEGSTYDYFVQSVYNDSIQNISSVISVKVETPADESPWKMTLEQKYIDSGVEGDDPYINSETYYFYDSNNSLAVSAVPEDFTRKTYVYDALGSLIEVTGYSYDEEAKAWNGSTRTVYTYYSDGKIKTSIEMSCDWETGEFIAPRMYKLYLYGTDGQLVRTENRKSEDDQLIGYVVYTYDSGLKTSEKIYSAGDEGEEVTEETTYTYDSENRLSESLVKALQYSIDPTRLTNLRREVYTYENGILKEMVTYQPKNSDIEQWGYKEKHQYVFDPASGLMTTDILSLADLNMETGEFIEWNQLTRMEYSYTEQLGADKIPGSFAGTADGDGVQLAWNAPGNNTDLTGYNLFRNYQLLETVAAGVVNYTDTQVREGIVYDYFVQPVYQNNELLNITPVVSVEGTTVGIRELSSSTIVYGTERGVEVSGDGLQVVRVYSVAGTLIAVRTASGDRLTVGGLEKGTYIVNVMARNGVYRQKVAIR